MTPTLSRRPVAFTIVSVLVLVTAACSSGASESGRSNRPSEAGGATIGSTQQAGGRSSIVERPAGPAADVSQELTGSAPPFLAAAGASVDLPAAGYVEHEYLAMGTATSYVSKGDLPPSGEFVLEPGPTAQYRTRIVVRRPAKAEDFSGTVVQEWLNVSGGVDANPDYVFTGEEIVRQGHAWVGVSAQLIGVEGGEIAVNVGIGDLAGKGLKKLDPERYGSLQHPGDAFAYDIFTQVARALREDGNAPMGGLSVDRILAIGESQSGFALTTYVNGVQPLTKAFDGFLIHSRGGAAMPLGAPGEPISVVSAITGPPTRIRTDQDVPVLTLVTESDITSVIGYYPARQPDSDHFRLWEVAGTAHADASLIGPVADMIDCGVAINRGPQRFAVRAALRQLDRWVRTGQAPPEAPRLEVEESEGSVKIKRDANGIALGGVRLPQVEVPAVALSGDPGPGGGVMCLLLGSTVPFNEEKLASMYGTRAAYMEAFEAATDRAIASGFALPEDRAAIVADGETLLGSALSS